MSSVTAVRENADIYFVHLQEPDEILRHRRTSQHECTQSETEITLYIYIYIYIYDRVGLNPFSSNIDWVNCKEKTYIKCQRGLIDPPYYIYRHLW
jgi:hypothetical protein